ncbi:hypothetical protein K439DRAFT_1610529 [Ramaria rubella]|nr:hypothetical protein K439DRAFT_1610529 [Ramaria rubella]
MSLRSATWSPLTNPELHPSMPKPKTMSLSNLVHPRNEQGQWSYASQRHELSYRTPQTIVKSRSSVDPEYSEVEDKDEDEDEDEYADEDDGEDELMEDANHSYISSREPIDFSLSQGSDQCYHEGRNNLSDFSMDQHRSTGSTSSEMHPPVDNQKACGSTSKRGSVLRSATIYSRLHRQDNNFGILLNGKWHCPYVEYKHEMPCTIWQDGYKSWYDLARHADSEHGPEEVELIERGLLTFDKAQWIRTEAQLVAIKETAENMFCRDCGTKFASNRHDSKERHVRKGAWYVILLAVTVTTDSYLHLSLQVKERRRNRDGCFLPQSSTRKREARLLLTTQEDR